MSLADFKEFEKLITNPNCGNDSSLSDDAFKKMQKVFEKQQLKKIANFLGSRILGHAMHGASSDSVDREQSLSQFFADVCSKTGASFSGQAENTYSTMVENWRKPKIEAGSTTLALEAYFFLHSINHGQDLALLVDHHLFDKLSFEEKFDRPPPGAFTPYIQKPKPQKKTSWTDHPALKYGVLGLATATGILLLVVQNSSAFMQPDKENELPGQAAFQNGMTSLRVADDENYFKLMNLSSDQGNPVAKSAIAISYWLGNASVKDPTQAQEYALAAIDGGIETLASEGDSSAQYMLGLMKYYGIGIQQSEAEGFSLLRKAKANGFSRASLQLADFAFKSEVSSDDCAGLEEARLAMNSGHVAAFTLLGRFHSKGYCTEPSDELAIDWFRKAANQGYSWGEQNLGWMYENDRGVDQDYELAVEWYQRAADQGLAVAQNDLGRMYEKGRGVKPDDKLAFEWFRKAANQGYAWGEHNLGWMYENERGVEQDYELAVEWYRKAAVQGNARAQNSLGWMYKNGLGVEISDEISIEWYEKATNQGSAAGQTNLGWMYENERGVELDYKLAVEWYRMAADQGYARAQTNLGWMYINGKGVSEDFDVGFDLFSKGADQGHKWSQASLGMAYLYGYGTEVSIPKAATWCRLGIDPNTSCADYCVGLTYFFQDENNPVISAAEAEEMLLKAAGLGHVCATTLLGVAYSKGEFDSDHPLDDAEKWLRIAVELGSVDAMYNLGSFLFHFRDQVIEEGSEVLELLTYAAENDHVPSACAMAAFRLAEKNGDQRLHEAGAYLTRLVELGEMSHNDASQMLVEPEFYADGLLDRYGLTNYTHPDFRLGSAALDFEAQIVEEIE